MRNLLLATFVFPSLAGCYAVTSNPIDPAPRGDPQVSRAPVVFERGALVTEPAESSFVEIEGYPSSMSDDGQWLVTCHWSSSARVRTTARITHLPSGSATTLEIAEVLYSCPAISGDGATLAYTTAIDRAATLWVMDRATLARRAVAYGEFVGVDLSDDGRRIVFAACTGVPCNPAVHLLDLDSGSERVVAQLEGAQPITLGLLLAGDGEHVLYPVALGDDRYAAALIGPDGETTRPIDLTGIPYWSGISDDGRVLVGTRSSGTRAWVDAPEPVLDLGVELDGEFVALGGEGDVTLPVYELALSGDGSTVVFSAPTDTGAEVMRLHLPDGRVQTIPGCDGLAVAPPLVSDDGSVVAVGVFHCEEDPTNEPHDRTRVHRLGAW